MHTSTAPTRHLPALRLPGFLAALLCLLVIALSPLPAQAQTADDGFNPSADSHVLSLLVQPDGKILVGGDFTTLAGQPCSRIGRLNPDGSLDTTFNSAADYTVYKLALQPDGKVLVAGDFTSLNGESHRFIGRLNTDGTLDTGFNPEVNNAVYALAVQPDGKILVGGAFTEIGGVAQEHIARLLPDGSLDTSFTAEAGAAVQALVVQPDGKIVVGGTFTEINEETHHYVARLNADGSLDATFTAGADVSLLALALQPDGKILLGGNFTKVNNEMRRYVARLNPDGSVDADFDPWTSGPVRSLVLQDDGKIVVGGLFTMLDGEPRQYLARINHDGSLDTGFNPGASWTVRALAVQPDGKIVVGGEFTAMGGLSRSHIGRLNPDGSLDQALNLASSSGPYAFALQPDGKVLLGGYMTSIGLESQPFISRVNTDGTVDTTFIPQGNGGVKALAVQPDGKIVLGGMFTSLDDQQHQRIGRLHPDGTVDAAFSPQSSGEVRALALQPDGRILVVGDFTAIGGQPRSGIARLNPDGSLDPTFNPGASVFGGGDPNVYALALQPDGKILVGGDFTMLGDKARSHFGRLSNTTAAIQNLSVAADGTSVIWQRSGAAPEVERTTFELSVDGAPYISLGEGTRTTGGWLLEDLSLPVGQNLFVRARGFYSSGRHNSSVSVTESVLNAYIPPQAPAFTSADQATFTVGTEGSFAVTTTGEPAPAVALTGALPTGVTLSDNGDGTATLAGTPAVGTGGVYTLTITAANCASPDAVQAFTLSVNEPPAITSDGYAIFSEGTPQSFTVTTSGHPECSLTLGGALPGGLTFTDIGDGTATLAGTSAPGTGGTYALTITAANGLSPDATQAFALTVQERPAIASADAATFTVGTAGSFTVTTTGYPKPTFTASGTLPTGVTLGDNGDGTATLSGTPAAGTGGAYALTITSANDVSPNATQSFTLTVQEGPAITSANAAAFTVGTAGTFTVTTTGYPKPTITESGALPDGVSFTDNGNGTATLAGTPAAGSDGTYALTITANNGVSPNAAQNFTLTVNEPMTPPPPGGSSDLYLPLVLRTSG